MTTAQLLWAAPLFTDRSSVANIIGFSYHDLLLLFPQRFLISRATNLTTEIISKFGQCSRDRRNAGNAVK